jgi:hypothetical protein
MAIVFEKEIVVSVYVSGIHYYMGAKEPVEFLKHPHQHLFRITVSVIESADRQIEFFMFRQELLDLLNRTFERDRLGAFQFGNRSCESIATTICEELLRLRYSVKQVAVFEDNEVGAIVKPIDVK